VVTALLVCALAAALSTALLVHVDDWIEHVAAGRDRAQALELARAGVDFARVILAEDQRLTAVDTLDEDWARILPPMSVEGGQLSGRIEDLQGRWNLNNLLRGGSIDSEALSTYRRLLVVLGLGEELADSLADWLDSDEKARPGGAESAYYLNLKPPYPAANGALEHVSNLRRIKGYDGTVLQRLAPYVAALPGVQPVNLNTAPPEVLHAIEPTLSLSEARQLVASRRSAYFRDLADFRARLPNPASATLASAVGVSSQYFLATAEIVVGSSRLVLNSLLERSAARGRAGGTSGKPKILWQSMQ
jgi:general secretion pathway protein K